MQVITIPINDICPRDGQRLRAVREDRVKSLAKSISEIGLNTPISVTAHEEHNETMGQLYTLVAGEHRMEACKSLGWTEIPAIVFDLTDLKARIWEIDENLVRAELLPLEHSEHLKERKRLYVLAYPKTEHGENREPSGQFGHTEDRCFVKDTAEKTGMSERDIRRSIHRAEEITPEVKDVIRDMPEIANKGVELDAIASTPKDKQSEVVQMVKTGKAKNAREAAEVVNPKPKPKPKPATAPPAPQSEPAAPVSPAAAPEQPKQAPASEPTSLPPKPEPALPPPVANATPTPTAQSQPANPAPPTRASTPAEPEQQGAPVLDIAKLAAKIGDYVSKIQQCGLTSKQLKEATPRKDMRLLYRSIGEFLIEASK